MGSIENQIAVVTGAGRGIGRAIAIELGDLGARLVLVARNRAELEDTSQRIGKNASVVPADVRKKDQLRRVFDSPVDILVNDRLIAHGEVVVVDENFGVRVLDIVSPSARIGNEAVS